MLNCHNPVCSRVLTPLVNRYSTGDIMDPQVLLPEIALDQFLPIFVGASFVLIFGLGYAATITLSKMGYFSKKWRTVGYLFWALQTYTLYDFAIRIESNDMTMKILMVTMIAYLFVPHLYFRLISDSDERYDPEEEIIQDSKQQQNT